jgi:hypothetical protein
MTAQTTLQATKECDDQREAAILRIEAIMLPGARSLAGTRQPDSPYKIEVEHDLTDRAPFRGRTVLIWRDCGRPAGYTCRSPYDGVSPSYGVQVIVRDDVSPLELAELARMARVLTEEIRQEADLRTSAQVALIDARRAAFAAVAAVDGQ